MKRCPVCKKEYPDEFRFCREDATELVSSALLVGSDSGLAAASTLDASSGSPPQPARALLLQQRQRTSFFAGVTAVVVIVAVAGVFAASRQRPGVSGNASARGSEATAAMNSATASASVSAAAAATDVPPSEASWKRHYCGPAGCSLEVPADWTGGQVEEEGNKDLVRWRFNAPGSKWVSVIVDIDVSRKGTPALDVWRDLDRRFEKGFKERYRREGDVAMAQLAGQEAALWTFEIQRKGQPWLKKIDYGITLPDGRGIAMLLTAPPEEFETYQPVFDEVVRRFRWEQMSAD